MNYFEKLADETILQIFRNLAQRELAVLRSLCRQFSRCGRELLYTDLTFSLTTRSVDAFLYVTRHPDLCQQVRHFIYDDSHLVRNLTVRNYFKKALSASHSKKRERRAHAFDEYCRLFDEQQQILESLFDILRDGLPCLSRLEKISVIGGPSRSPNCSFKGRARSDSYASTAVGLSYWSYHNQSRYQFFERKGFHDLIKALNQPQIRLREVHIGNWSEGKRRLPLKMGLPISSLSLRNAEDNAALMAKMAGAFNNVTSLNLQLDGRGRAQGHHYAVPDIDCLFVILPAMHHLSRVSLGFTHLELNADESKRLLLGLKWRCLTYLRL